MGYIRKALEKGYLEPGLHVELTTCFSVSSILDGACVACCLILSTGSHHVRKRGGANVQRTSAIKQKFEKFLQALPQAENRGLYKNSAF